MYSRTVNNSKTIQDLPIFIIIRRLVIDPAVVYAIIVGSTVLFLFFWAKATVTVDSVFMLLMIHATNQFLIVSEYLKLYDDKQYTYCMNPNKQNNLQYCKCIKCITKYHKYTLR